ncbi:MAG: acyl-[acyl-carrier-protein] thioesterase [Clostridium sp.]|jgi:acyl-ACP thioesterase|nr:acyl-[acyl-carrier-protein] thioesterase [Clostridium sp.]
MYTFDSRIRYSESDSEGRLTFSSLLNYFQDCSTFQSEDLGLGIGYLQSLHLVWVLASWSVAVERYPRLCEEVEIGTFPYEFRGCLGARNFFLRDRQGRYLAKAGSLWTLLDTDRMKPVSAPVSMLEKYRLEPRLEMEYPPRKIPLPPDCLEQEPLTVRRYHLDTNRHVNNGRYIDMAMAYLPEGFAVRRMRAEYRKQAWLDDVICPYVGKTQETYVVSLKDRQGSPYANIELSCGGVAVREDPAKE